ncbi:MAG: phosphotransferase [Gaiellaceae bacterium]
MRLNAASPWTDRHWLDQAHAWIDEQLARLELSLDGTVEQTHVAPWSTVLRVPTDAGALWFKANMAALSHESAVVQLLAARRSELLPELLAADPDRGWMLQADAGTRLRELLAEDGRVERWEQILPLYAELQIEAAPDWQALLGAGAPDRRLRFLPAQYEQLVADGEALQPALPDGLSDEEVRSVRLLVPLVTRLSEELDAVGLPETIQHDDFHDGQVFVRDDRYRFIDWGDSCVSHPFFTLSVTLRVLALKLGVELGAPELDRFRDAYLEPWTRFRSRAELEAAAATAFVLGRACRALAWRRIAKGLPPPFDEEYADAAPGWLRHFLEAI